MPEVSVAELHMLNAVELCTTEHTAHKGFTDPTAIFLVEWRDMDLMDY